jgi:hypothetical protein
MIRFSLQEAGVKYLIVFSIGAVFFYHIRGMLPWLWETFLGSEDLKIVLGIVAAWVVAGHVFSGFTLQRRDFRGRRDHE